MRKLGREGTPGPQGVKEGSVRVPIHAGSVGSCAG